MLLDKVLTQLDSVLAVQVWMVFSIQIQIESIAIVMLLNILLGMYRLEVVYAKQAIIVQVIVLLLVKFVAHQFQEI